MDKKQSATTGFREPFPAEPTPGPSEKTSVDSPRIPQPGSEMPGQSQKADLKPRHEKSIPDDPCWDVFLPDDEYAADEELLADGHWEWDARDRDMQSDWDPWS